MIKLGRYVCDGQVPIVVTDKGTPAENPMHGPWITYHIEGAPPTTSATVLFSVFKQLQDSGYRHEDQPLEGSRAGGKRSALIEAVRRACHETRAPDRVFIVGVVVDKDTFASLTEDERVFLTCNGVCRVLEEA